MEKKLNKEKIYMEDLSIKQKIVIANADIDYKNIKTIMDKYLSSVDVLILLSENSLNIKVKDLILFNKDRCQIKVIENFNSKQELNNYAYTLLGNLQSTVKDGKIFILMSNTEFYENYNLMAKNLYKNSLENLMDIDIPYIDINSSFENKDFMKEEIKYKSYKLKDYINKETNYINDYVLNFPLLTEQIKMLKKENINYKESNFNRFMNKSINECLEILENEDDINEMVYKFKDLQDRYNKEVAIYEPIDENNCLLKTFKLIMKYVAKLILPYRKLTKDLN